MKRFIVSIFEEMIKACGVCVLGIGSVSLFSYSAGMPRLFPWVQPSMPIVIGFTLAGLGMFLCGIQLEKSLNDRR
jgi:hypothetical protein